MPSHSQNIGEKPKRLEKVVASKQIRSVVETDEERRARLEYNAATKRLRLAKETRKTRLEKMVATAEVRCGRCGFVPQTYSEKLATMLIIQT